MKEIYYWEREELTDPERILNHPLSTHRPDFKKYSLSSCFMKMLFILFKCVITRKVTFIHCFYLWWLIFPLQIATQIAVLIAKVARLDCPRQWPELIPILIESVKVQDDLRQHRALLTFYHVTKTLASKRLAADRKLFYDVSDLT